MSDEQCGPKCDTFLPYLTLTELSFFFFFSAGGAPLIVCLSMAATPVHTNKSVILLFTPNKPEIDNITTSLLQLPKKKLH